MPNIAERIFGRRGERSEKRGLGPIEAWLRDYYENGGSSPSGERVSQKSAMALATVYACQTLIADLVSTLPVDVMRKIDGVPTPQEAPDWLESPVPNDPSITRTVHFNQVAMAELADGNDFTLVLPHVLDPQVLTVLDPRSVTIKSDGNLRPVYEVRSGSSTQTWGPDNIIHIPRTIRPGESRGLSPIDEASLTLGTYMAATKHAGRFYRNGALLATILEVPGEMEEADAIAMRDRFDQAHTGDNVFKTGVLTGGTKANTLGVTPEQAQFLETLKHGTVEVCRIYRVPPMLVGVNEPGAVSYASSVEAVKAMARNTLAPFLRPIEMAYSRLLPDPETYLRFDMNGLLRADPEARWNAYGIAAEKGIFNRDEIRAWEEMGPLPDGQGKIYTVQAQMTDLDKIANPPPPPPMLSGPPGGGPAPDPTRPGEAPAARSDPGEFGEERHHPGGMPHDQKKHGNWAIGMSKEPFKPTYASGYDAMEAHMSEAQRRAALRDPADQNAIDTYQSQRWLEINDPLRAGQPLPDRYESPMPNGESPAGDASRLDKMMRGEGGMPFDAFLYRGISDSEVLPPENLVGKVVRDKAFLSTTTDQYSAESFSFPGGGKPGAAVVVISARKGTPAVVADYEVILPRDTELYITFDTTVPGVGTRVIHAEIRP